ncbi:MAG: hypothetical protein GX581_02520 [Syntrophomonadaceae bacterium]|jgi:chromosome segregation ATPase|nr:hypothetical protein [Syntrophomonadaceae bacterium]
MNNEEKILQMLEVITADVGSLKTDVGSLKTDVSSLKKGQAALEKGQRKLQSDVTVIKRDLEAAWSDILRIDKKIDAQQEEIDTIKSGQF